MKAEIIIRINGGEVGVRVRVRDTTVYRSMHDQDATIRIFHAFFNGYEPEGYTGMQARVVEAALIAAEKLGER